MAARVAELEDVADQARNRANKMEKDKNRLQIEVRDVTVQLETVSKCPLMVVVPVSLTTTNFVSDST